MTWQVTDDVSRPVVLTYGSRALTSIHVHIVPIRRANYNRATGCSYDRIMTSTPPSPLLSGKGYFSVPFMRDEASEQWTDAFTLLGRLTASNHVSFRGVQPFFPRYFWNILWLSCRPSPAQTSEAQRQVEARDIQDQGLENQGPVWRSLIGEFWKRDQELQAQGMSFLCAVQQEFNAISYRYLRAWLHCPLPGNRLKLFVHARKSYSFSALWMCSSPLSCLELHPST